MSLTQDRLLTAAEVAKMFGKSEVSLAKMRMTPGLGPRFVKVSARSIRYRESDVLRYLDQQTFESTNGSGR